MGDKGYYLRMDTVLTQSFSRESISQFLDQVAEDLNILTQYFKPPSTRNLANASNPKKRPAYTRQQLRYCS